ncbi:MAG: hypothetical protein ACR2HX_05330 [Pyrinomonadaceae bacterium]
MQNLIDYLEGDESIEDFLEAFPTVKRAGHRCHRAGKLKMLGNGVTFRSHEATSAF